MQLILYFEGVDLGEFLVLYVSSMVILIDLEVENVIMQASSSSLYIPEPEDAVSHGDASLAVNDFLTRTSL